MVVMRARTRSGAAAQDLQRIGHLNRRHRRDDGVQHPGRLAGGLHAGRRIGIDAAQARRAAGDHRHGEAVTAHRRAVDPGNAPAHREIVDQVAGLEIVRAVQDQVRVAQQLRDVRGVRSATMPRTRTAELMRAMRRSAATALGSDSAASASSNSHWRCRLLGST